MSENFTNFIKKSSANVTSEEIIIPSGNDEKNSMKYSSTSSKSQFRSVGSTIQAHSIYITQANTSHQSTDSSVYASLYIVDSNCPNTKFYVVNDFAIKSHQTFFVEKNITLTPSQYLCIEYTESKSVNIDISCSCVEII